MKISIVSIMLVMSSAVLPTGQVMACADEAWEVEFEDEQLTIEDIERLYTDAVRNQGS
ncbi:hypothetical protein GH722_17750 [Alphaproteobacteria bacterium HT1-32]|nr:hypothetical protein [Alphaproteobacteria bacterium HT1-32]